MAEHKIDGGTMLLFIDPAGGTNYDTVVCLTSVGQSMSVQPVDASSACGPDKSPGAIDISYTFEGQHLQDPITGQISGTDLRLLLMAEQTVGWKLSPETPVAGDEIQEGTGYLSELSSTYSYSEIGVFSGTLQPYGVPTITVFNPTPPGPGGLLAFRITVDSLANIYFMDIENYLSTNFDCIVDYGDGNIVNYSGSNLYALSNIYSPGTYLVIITNTNNVPLNIIQQLSVCTFDNIYNLNYGNVEILFFNSNPKFNNPIDLDGYQGSVISIRNLTIDSNSDIILPATSTTIIEGQFGYNHLTSSQVNDILATFANYNSVGNLELNNQTPPAPPTGNGIFDKANLIQNGWTVTTD